MLISLVLTASFANASDCSDYSGQAFGLCNAYCEATDCDDNPNANQQACDNLYSLFEAATGEAPPCEITEYDVRTVYSGDDSIEVFVNGVAVAYQSGDFAWSQENSHQTILTSGDHTIAYRVWDVARVIAGLGAFITVDGAIVAAVDDGSSFLVTSTDPGAGWADVGFDDSAFTVAQSCTWDPWWSTNLAELDANGIVWGWSSSSCNPYTTPEAWFRVNLSLP